jgi:hypothetical protein
MLWSPSICGLGSFFLPLFTGVRGIGILRSSSVSGSANFALSEFCAVRTGLWSVA